MGIVNTVFSVVFVSVFFVLCRCLTQTSVGQTLESKWFTVLRAKHFCKGTIAGEMWNLRLERPRRPLWLKNVDDPAPLEQQDVAMLTAVSGESTSVKRRAVARADDEERAPVTRHGRHVGDMAQTSVPIP